MKKNIHFLSTLLFLAFFAFGCEEAIDQKNLKISYGTSFGFCVGYCNQQLKVAGTLATFTKSGHGDTVITKTCTKPVNETEWNSLVNMIDYKKFQKLSATIGCPDCADGGAEWIEVQAGDQKHRVIFEYGKEPEEVKDYIKILRGLNDSFKDCN